MEWKISHGLTEYPDALATMAARVAAIQKGEANELVWLVEHPPLYTLGTSAKASDVLGSSPHRGGVRRGADTRQDINREATLCGSPPPILPPIGGGVVSFPTYETGRGGQVTYHGPGQRVVYLMLDLKKRAAAKGGEPDLRAYVKQLEQWIILTLAEFGIESFTREGRVGVWVEESLVASRQSPVVRDIATDAVFPPPLRGRLGGGLACAEVSSNNPAMAQVVPPPHPASPEASQDFLSLYRGGGEPAALIVPTRDATSLTTHYSLPTTHEKKIAALGVRVQKWVTSHGIAINVNPDLSHYAGIVPCGIREFGVTSMQALGADVRMEEVDAVLQQKFVQVFGS